MTQDCIKKLLTDGKSRLDLCISLDKLLNAILRQPDGGKFSIKTERSYYSKMHKLELCLNCLTSDFVLNGHQNIIVLILN